MASTPSDAPAPQRPAPLSRLTLADTSAVPAPGIALFASNRTDSYHRPKTATAEEVDPTTLTPLRAHYLKRELVTLQFGAELDILSNPDALALLGPPFLPKERFVNGVPSEKPVERGQNNSADQVDLPFLRYFFNHFVLSFPFLVNAPKTFFSHKLQPFTHSFFARNITGEEERDEETKRRKLAGKVEKHFGLVMAAAIKLSDNNGDEEVVRVTEPGMEQDTRPNDDDAFVATPTDDRPMAMAAIVGQSNQAPRPEGAPDAGGPAVPSLNHGFEVNVVAIRNVRVKGRMRSKVHEEFVIRTRNRGWADTFVSRRYGDFLKLADTLRTELPEADIRSPPAKDRRTVEARMGEDASPATTPTTPSMENVGSPPNTPDSQNMSAPGHLARERNRLTLRAYLHRLLNKPDIANTENMRNFLLHNPITLSQDELRDVEAREEMDRAREVELGRFRSEVEGRVRELEGHLRGFREELVKSDGLSRVFGTIRKTPTVEGLPIEYRKVIEWARISLASTIYQLFLGSDNSSSAFTQLKRMHGLMPYWAMRGVLRISNPVAMIRGILDLFLARPFGASSLLQRMFTSGLYDEVKEYKMDAEKVANKIADERMCVRVRNYIAAPKEIQDFYDEEAKAEKMDIISIILRSPEGPAFDREAYQRVARAAKAYDEYKAYRDNLENPDENEGPANDDAWLYEDLHVYMRLLRRARDKEQMIELIFEGTTSELLKDIVTIFYSPLMQVYKAANIADSLYDLQKFIDDLIKTVEQAEEFTFGDPQRIVQTFVDLVGRHEGSFYHFVYQVHSKGAGLFDGLMHWIELFVNFVREGLTSTVSLEVLLPHSGDERKAILAEVDEIIEYHRKLKVAHHERMTRRMARGDPDEKNQDAAFVQGVMSNLHLAKVVGDVDDMANEAEFSESDDEDQFTDAISGQEAPLPSSRGSNDSSRSSAPTVGEGHRSKKKEKATIEPPELHHIPLLTPIFTEIVKELLRQPAASSSRQTA